MTKKTAEIPYFEQKIADILSNHQVKKILPFLPIPLLILITFIFIAPILPGAHTLTGLNDWDLFQSYYHPIRVALLAHQFPWWNPYNAGGAPLFANPQVGVFSIQTPFVYYFGVTAGLKYAAVLYYLLGAIGMYYLTRRLGSPTIRAALLSLVWTFSSFTAFHFYIGHYIFLSYLLVPWLFYFLIKIDDNFWFWIPFGLGIALFINTALHNTAIQALIILTLASPFIWYSGGHKLKTLGAYGLAVIIAAPLALPKLLLSLQFVSEFSRVSEPQVQLPIPWRAAWQALTGIHQTVSNTSLVSNVGWWEVSAFVGILTIIIAIIGAVISVSQRRYLPLILCLLAALAFDIALGGHLYRGLLHLPVLNLTRVPSRWLAWVIFPVILAAGAFRHKWLYLETLIGLALIITIGQEFTFIRPQLATVFTTPLPVVQAQSFEQFDGYPPVTNGYTGMYEAEQAGYGEVRGYEAILGYDFISRPTARCGINNGCNLLSANAKLVFWSPNVIKIERLGDGPITVNINPSSYMWINGHQAYPNSKVTDPLETVVITDPASHITIEMKPGKLFKKSPQSNTPSSRDGV